MAGTELFDDRAVQASLSKLGGQLSVSLARSMGVAGGKIMRDTAKALAPEYDGSTGLAGGKNVDIPPVPGLLKSAIYLAFKERLSDSGHVTYGISWNSKIAPHGHLLEFGHWRLNKIVNGIPTNIPLKTPKWVPAHPFLRPAYNVALVPARAAMFERGRERLPELLREAKA
ncbi:MAG TPA: HK97 gp10 family phage protein [Rhodanobacteraceae bacterium]|nr:HK97 gp10 family phage protein [Rhodanobacteraceae bacterium]